MKQNLLLFIMCFSFTLSTVSQEAPESGKKFRIVNGSGLYLTANPDYEGYNPWFIDSLYTAPSSTSTEYTLNGETVISVVNTDPIQQIFTLSNPNPNDPDVWAIEASNGAYLTQSPEYDWDCILGPSSDVASSQLFFVDQGYGLYLLQLSTRSDGYLATDNAEEGEIIGTYEDGWQYLHRSTVYNDKPADQDNNQAIWYFEKVTTTGIDDVRLDKNAIAVFPTLANETVTVSNLTVGTRIAVYDIAGSKVMDVIYDGKLGISSLISGVYIVATPDGGKAKFIKQ